MGMLPGEIVFGDNFAGMLPRQSPKFFNVTSSTLPYR